MAVAQANSWSAVDGRLVVVRYHAVGSTGRGLVPGDPLADTRYYDEKYITTIFYANSLAVFSYCCERWPSLICLVPSRGLY